MLTALITVLRISAGLVGVLFAAGNVINDDVLGSMEFATKLTGAKLILVMGKASGYCKIQ